MIVDKEKSGVWDLFYSAYKNYSFQICVVFFRSVHTETVGSFPQHE